MRLPGLDPEVLADLRRRETSERDPSRERSTAHPFGDPEPVEHWPCRGGCGAMVGVPQAALDAFAAMQGLAAKKREQPLSKAKVMWCPSCKKADDELARMQREARRPMRQTELPAMNKNVRDLARRTGATADEDAENDEPSVMTPDHRRWRKP